MREREPDELFPFLRGRWSAVVAFTFLGVCIAASFYGGWLSVPDSLRGDYAWVLVGVSAWMSAMGLQRRAGFPEVRRRRLWWRLATGLGVVAAGAFFLAGDALGVAPVPALLSAAVWTTLSSFAPPKPAFEEPEAVGAPA